MRVTKRPSNLLDATDLTKATTETQRSGPEFYDVYYIAPGLYVPVHAASAPG